jgi:hypothetical protein
LQGKKERKKEEGIVEKRKTVETRKSQETIPILFFSKVRFGGE